MKFVLSTAFSSVAHSVEIAKTADSHGWEAVSCSDHVVHPETISTPYPYTADGARRWDAFTDWPDPWVMIGAMATVTKHIKFTQNIYVLPMRNPLLVAKAVGTAAVISNNRVILTIGVGWSKDEFALLGQDFHNRGRRNDEMIEIMRKLWSGNMVEHHGEFYDFDRLEMNPAPSEYVPLWTGGISEPAFKRAARIADGWLSDLQTSAEITDCINKIKRYRVDHGRADVPLSVMATPSDAFTIDAYQRLEDAGVTHILTQPWPFYSGASNKLEDKLDGIKRFADDMIAKMS
ncbi:MAG: LLM class F420-dependent oxidoreductase [Pseudomonadales bacterium]